MNTAKIIKTVEYGICPHCSKEIIISSSMSTPVVGWVLRKADVQKAKDQAKEGIKALKLSDEKMVLGWLDNEDTIIGPADVEPLVRQLSEQKSEGKIQKEVK